MESSCSCGASCLAALALLTFVEGDSAIRDTMDQPHPLMLDKDMITLRPQVRIQAILEIMMFKIKE